ncbi:Amino-acid carrier protein AlsT [BD1-7 clade bacterium]|uniref:Amino-acid carrier protein AlsT n=1 Tax=BD1-7 clade bacterium TaxID=2029982 RepID=A0A5S9P7U0_9GAMM|nr:Amino-acid carrier protein AlsT [BD1-7 clade bacterium]
MNEIVNVINEILWSHVLIYLLIFASLFFTISLKFIQVRQFFTAWKLLARGKNSQRGHVSPWEALATSLAARIGTGNLAGVSVAITLGGPGAVFWMWLIAAMGMATAFVEASLAQVFKIRNKDGSFRGGPSYYIQYGLGQRWLGIVFAILLIIAFGLVFVAVQSHTIAQAAQNSFSVPDSVTAIILIVLSAAVVWGGMSRIAHFAGKVVPFMAIAYMLVALYVLLSNITEVPGILYNIASSGMGLDQAAGGTTGFALSAAMSNGVKRGLFSNEAGMGSAPNAAAAADPEPPHPAAQGYVQMLGVFIDTILVCTATAVIILLSGVYTQGMGMEGITLTQQALSSEVGNWGNYFVAFAIFLFSFTTIVGNYAYAESCLRFISNTKHVILGYRCCFLFMIFWGISANMPTIWNAADASMAMMATVNLITILLLGKYAWRVAKDFETQFKVTPNPQFDPSMFPELEGKIDPNAWPKIEK